MSLENQLNLKFPIYWNGWAVEEAFVRLLVYKVLTNRPKKIVELGSGLSTLITVKTLAILDYDFSFFSFDSDESFLEETKNLLVAENLADDSRINLICSKLKDIDVNGGKYSWYNPENFNFDFDQINLLIVDGPVGALCKNARYPAIPILKKYLKTGSVVLLDDAKRDDEKEIMELWKKENSEISSVHLENTERGAAEIRFK